MWAGDTECGQRALPQIRREVGGEGRWVHGRHDGDKRGWLEDTDIFFTTDHGELQGDFGLIYKGPFHVDALMRLPFIWRPAPSTGSPTGAVVADPVGQVDLAATFCAIAGVEAPDWIQGHVLPTADGALGGPGGNHDAYVVSFTTIARISRS